MRGLLGVAVLLVANLWSVGGASGQSAHDTASAEHFNADGFRNDRYRSPLPQEVPGGTTVTAAELARLIESKAPALIDVQAVTLRREAAEFGLSWLPSEPRYNIPGSVWLPNVGYGELEPFMVAFFRDNLARISDGNYDFPIVFYCIADCWMSWNSVQRAHRWGYRNLYWLRNGTDGWEAAGGQLEPSEPESILDYLP